MGEREVPDEVSASVQGAKWIVFERGELESAIALGNSSWKSAKRVDRRALKRDNPLLSAEKTSVVLGRTVRVPEEVHAAYRLRLNDYKLHTQAAGQSENGEDQKPFSNQNPMHNEQGLPRGRSSSTQKSKRVTTVAQSNRELRTKHL